MRVAQMLDTLVWGGAQKMQLFLVEMLQPLGIEITVISLSAPSNSLFEKKLDEAGVRVVFCPFPKLFTPKSFLNVVKLLQNEKFDLLHSYLTYSNIIGPLAGVLTGTPTIASLRSANFEGRNYTQKRASIENFSLRYLATRIMANGKAVEEYANYRLKHTRCIDVINNAVHLLPPISLSEREQVRQEIIGDPSRQFVITVGRLTDAKGFHDLIDAFAIVHAQEPSAVLVMAGGGAMLIELSTHVNQLGLQKTVIFLGERTDISRLLAAADIYVNSSHWEGTPVSVLEAMASGLPIVATQVGENPYLLEGDAGIIVPPHNPVELAAALISLLTTPELQKKLGLAAYGRVKTLYTPEKWTSNILTLYSKITPKAYPYLDVALNSGKEV